MIWIPLRAVAKQRARLTRPRRGRKSRAYTPQPTVHFENGVAAGYVAEGGIHYGKIPLGISVEIHKDGFSVDVFPLECSVRPVGVRGDIDNCVKSILDGLNGVAWDDDRQIELLDITFVGAPRKGTSYDDIQGPELGGTS
jgi:Holliday junction resolvase RusA-like endonuclease